MHRFGLFCFAILFALGCPEEPEEEPEKEPAKEVPSPNDPPSAKQDAGTPVTPPIVGDAGPTDPISEDAGSQSPPVATDGGVPETGPPDAGQEPPADPDAGVSFHANEDVFNLLKPDCMACHLSGDKDFFKDLETFESKLVYNPFFVTPGDAAASELYKLLLGEGTTFSQMPTVGDDFDTLSSSGQTEITTEEIEAWINNLEDPNGGPDGEVIYLTPEMHLRRVAIALTGQLPSKEQIDLIRTTTEPESVIERRSMAT